METFYIYLFGLIGWLICVIWNFEAYIATIKDKDKISFVTKWKIYFNGSSTTFILSFLFALLFVMLISLGGVQFAIEVMKSKGINIGFDITSPIALYIIAVILCTGTEFIMNAVRRRYNSIKANPNISPQLLNPKDFSKFLTGKDG